MLLALVRHGVVKTTGKRLYARTPGLHLTAEGQTQAQDAAERLAERDMAPDVIYASPMERTQETAKIIARRHGKRVRTSKGVNEVDIGEWTNKTWTSLAKKPEWAALQTRPSVFAFPGGETVLQAHARAVAAVEKMRGIHMGETVVVVSHGDIIKLLVAHYAGIHVDLYQRIVVAPCSISSFAFHPERPPMMLGVNA